MNAYPLTLNEIGDNAAPSAKKELVAREAIAPMEVVSISSAADGKKWDSFVQTCERATAYHLFSWRHVITETFAHPCHYLAAIDSHGTWQGVLPLVHVRGWPFGNTLVSLPFVNYGGMLFKTSEAATRLIDSAEELRKSVGADLVELRHVESCVALPTKSHKVTMILGLGPDADSQWKGLNGKVRNQVRKAQSSNLHSTIGQAELLDDFYRVFVRNMRDLGSPVLPKRFFSSVLDSFQDSTRIIAIYQGAEVVSAGILHWFKDAMEVPWASSLREFNSLCPNNLMYWEAIRFAIGRGFRTFDFGRCSPDGGTYKFKSQWNAKPVVLNWQYVAVEGNQLPDQQDYGKKYQLAVNLWQHLPVGVTRIIGPSIRKRINL